MELLLTTDIIGTLTELDTDLLLAVNRRHSAVGDTFMWLVSRKFEWIPMYAALVYVMLRNFHWKMVLIALLAMGAIFALTDACNTQLLRPAVARLRPSNLDNPVSTWVHVVDGYRGGPYGFPSAHSSNSWGLVFFITWLFRHRGLTLFFAFWATLQCYSRLYLGVHYPGDLMAGMLLAFLSATLVYFLVRRFTKLPVPTDLKHPYVPVCVGAVTLLAFLAYSITINFFLN